MRRESGSRHCRNDQEFRIEMGELLKEQGSDEWK